MWISVYFKDSPVLGVAQITVGQGAVMLCGWEGNRRSGITLAMRHRLSGLSTYRLNGQCAGDEHLAYTSRHGHLIFSAVRIVFFHFKSKQIVIVGLKSHQ